LLPTAETAGGLAWQTVTRLGEAQLLLPAMALASAWLLWRHRAGRLVACWWVATAVAALITTATKLAFIGWGWGSAAWNFTGISGHAMFAAAILPVLGRVVEGRLPPSWHGAGLSAGLVLALAVAVSRVPVRAHSWSEVLSGAALGLAATVATLGWAHAPRIRLSAWLPLLVAAGLSVGVVQAPPSRTHGWVIALALELAGHQEPWTRARLHARAAAARALPAPVPSHSQ